MPWPADLVVHYQDRVIEGYALNRAWQEIPFAGVVALIDTVRTRLLEFALDLRSKVEETHTPFDKIEPSLVDRAVTVPQLRR